MRYVLNERGMDFVQKVMPASRSGAGTLPHSYHIAEQCMKEGIEGDFVECGVYAGVHPAIFADVVQDYVEKGYPLRKVHLFDSFEGIQEAGPNDDESITGCIGVGQGRLVTTGVSACSRDNVMEFMKQWNVNPTLLEYHVGWFQNTVKKAARHIGKIAILRMDCDVYEATKACLPYLYPKLVSGGFFVCDDWTLTGCRKATEEFLAEIGHRNVEPIPVENGGGCHWWRKP